MVDMYKMNRKMQFKLHLQKKTVIYKVNEMVKSGTTLVYYLF